jgi:hypothetical protein
VDHQSLRFWSAQGSDAWLQHVRAHLELAAPAAPRDHEILALASDAFLVRRTWPGHVLASGGTFENHSLALIVFGGDGLTTHAEWFDLEREAEALARFDELTATRQPAPRRARANAATASATRLEAVLAARDADAIADFFSDDFEGLDHTTGASYDRAGAIVTTRGSLAHRGMTLRHEPLATLGERLMLCRYLFTSSGVARGGFDIGPLEVEKVMLLEVDEHGRRRRNEWFAPEHLADAIACLYERHAELLPEGPGRTRAEATARSVAFYKGPLTLERYAAIYASDVERVDRRTMVGTGHTRGIEAILRGHRAVVEMSETLEGRIEGRVDDVLALGDDRLLLRWTNFGTLRDGGGPYERSFLALSVYGPDGLVTRSEWFDADQDAAAFARFDALAAQAPAVGSQSRPG